MSQPDDPYYPYPPPTYRGTPLEQETTDKGPRYYFIRQEAARWSKRTGRFFIQWLWNDDLDTRKPDEMPTKDEA